MNLYQIRVAIYEVATNYEIPIVVHLFNGRTPDEAAAYHDAHRKSDRFLRECEDTSVFDNAVACRASVSEGWVKLA